MEAGASPLSFSKRCHGPFLDYVRVKSFVWALLAPPINHSRETLFFKLHGRLKGEAEAPADANHRGSQSLGYVWARAEPHLEGDSLPGRPPSAAGFPARPLRPFENPRLRLPRPDLGTLRPGPVSLPAFQGPSSRPRGSPSSVSHCTRLR